MDEPQRVDHDRQLRLHSTVQEVKLEFKRIGAKSQELVLKLGYELEKDLRAEDVCEEIKSILNDEIVIGLISRRNIERYCPDKWKKKTKPKKEKENVNLSFPKQNGQPAMITTNGKVILEEQDDSKLDKRETVIVDRYQGELDDKELSDIENLELNKSALSDDDDDYLEFEFSFPFDKLRQYMAGEFNNHKGTEPIWIHGRLNKFTGIILNADLGRISDQY